MSAASSILTVSVIAAASMAQHSNAGIATIIDSFSSSGSLGAEGSGYAGLGEFSTAGWSIGSGHVGSRLLYSNSWGDGLVAQSMSGNGQFVASLNGGTSSDTQLIAQYRVSAAIDLSGAGTSILVRGSGTASGGDADNAAYGIGVVLFNGAATDGSYANRCWLQFNQYGAQTLGNFSFSIADLAAAAAAGQADAENFDFSQVNGFQFYQYAYAGGQWDYVSTSFEIVPAPGAVALLGLAGAAGIRRRRA